MSVIQYSTTAKLPHDTYFLIKLNSTVLFQIIESFFSMTLSLIVTVLKNKAKTQVYIVHYCFSKVFSVGIITRFICWSLGYSVLPCKSLKIRKIWIKNSFTQIISFCYYECHFFWTNASIDVFDQRIFNIIMDIIMYIIMDRQEA